MESYIADHLPLSHHVDKNIIATRNGDYMVVYRLEGKTHQTASERQLSSWIDELNNLIRTMASENPNLSIWSHIIRKKIELADSGMFDNYFAEQLNQHYLSGFMDENLMLNELYLTVIYRLGTGDATANFFQSLVKLSLEEKLVEQEERLEKFRYLINTITTGLKGYGATLLSTYADDHGIVFSEPMEFFSYLLNGEESKVPVTREHIYNALPQNRLLFSTHGELVEIRQSNKSKFGAILEIKEYSEDSYSGQLNDLLHTKYEFIFTQSFSLISKNAALGYMTRQRKFLIDSKDVSTSQINQLQDGLDQIQAGRVVMGQHHSSLIVFSDSARESLNYLSDAKTIFANSGLISVSSDLGVEASYWAQIPGNWNFRTRPCVITSQNYLCFSPFHNYMTGKAKNNPWGPYVTLLKTSANTPIYFNYHSTSLSKDSLGDRPLGNTMIFGRSGTGKTVMLAALIAQSLKFNPKVVAIDKDRGLDTLIRAVGGKYMPLTFGEPTGFNPFQLPDTNDNRLFIKHLIRILISNDVVTQEDENDIDRALDSIYLMKQEYRRLSILMQSLPNVPNENSDHPTVFDRLRKWTYAHNGDYAWVFDNSEDFLDLNTHRIYGFDITEFLEDETICNAINYYINHRVTELQSGGEPFIMVMDEFWKSIQDPSMASEALDKAKTIRKANGLMVYVTQEPGDLLNSPQGKSIAAQCSTIICLPDAQAKKNDYVDILQLSEAEFSKFKELGEQSRHFLVKQGDVTNAHNDFFSSAIATLDLSNCQDELLVLSGTPDRALLAEELIDKYGEDPKNWLPIYYEKCYEIIGRN